MSTSRSATATLKAMTGAVRSLLLLAAFPLGVGCGDKLGGDPCPDTHRRIGGDCVPIFDDCPGAAERPVLGGGCRQVGVTQCATGFVSDHEGGCDPVLPDHDCPPGTMEALGQTACVRVGVTRCASGFVSDMEGGCDAILPADPCPDDSMAVLGFTDCQPIGDCGVGTWGSIGDDGSTLFVDQSYDGTAPSDGSLAAPFLTVGEALVQVAPGGQIAVAAGDYVERLTITKQLRLSGRCAAMVTLRGARVLSTDYPPVRISSGGSGSTLRGLTLTGDAEGLVVSGAQAVTVENVQVTDSADVGVWLPGASELTLRRVLVRGATWAGIWSEGSDLVLDHSAVIDTNPLPGGTWGRGIYAQCKASTGVCGSLHVAGSLVASNRDQGIVAFGVDTTVTRSVVRDTLPQQSDELYGRGINAQCDENIGSCGTLLVEDSLVVGNRDVGILAVSVDALVSGTVVRDTLPMQRDQSGGMGIQAMCDSDRGSCGSLRVQSCLVVGNRADGIIAFGPDASVTSSIVRDTLPQQSDLSTGGGIHALCDPDLGICGHLLVSGSLVTGNHADGIAVFGADVTVRSSVVRDNLPQQSDQAFGTGIAAQCNPNLGVCGKLIVQSCLVAANRLTGIAAHGVDATVLASAILDTRPQASNQGFGRGIAAQCDTDLGACARLHVEGSVIDGCYNTGIFAAGVHATFHNVVVNNTRPDQNTTGISTDDYGQGMWVLCDHRVGVCGSLSMTDCLIRASYTAAVAIQGTSGFIESVLIDSVLPRALDGGFGYGIQIEGLPGYDLPVLDITSSFITEAPLASILYYRATGTITETVVTGADFAVVWASSPQQPTLGEGNLLEGHYENGLTQQDLAPSPAPDPAVPITVGL